jgi:hypothetical protein
MKVFFRLFLQALFQTVVFVAIAFAIDVVTNSNWFSTHKFFLLPFLIFFTGLFLVVAVQYWGTPAKPDSSNYLILPFAKDGAEDYQRMKIMAGVQGDNIFINFVLTIASTVLDHAVLGRKLAMFDEENQTLILINNPVLDNIKPITGIDT